MLHHRASEFGKAAPPERQTAAPMGVGSGGSCKKEHVNSRRRPYNDPDRVAIRKVRDAKERVLRVIVAFNALTADEQELVADRLAEIMGVRPEIAIDPPFGMGLEDHRRCLIRSWRALPDSDRQAFLARVSGRGGWA